MRRTILAVLIAAAVVAGCGDAEPTAAESRMNAQQTIPARDEAPTDTVGRGGNLMGSGH